MGAFPSYREEKKALSFRGCAWMKLILEQRQSLQVVMTTELRQAIELLQLTNYDLRQFIEKEAEDNPFIEVIEREDSFYSRRPSKFRSSTDSEVDPLDFVSIEDNSLYSHLVHQVNLLKIDEKLREILYIFIERLDESGYLPFTNESLSQMLQVPEWKIAKARNLLLNIEPLGIGAYDLTERLLVQAKEKYPEDVFLHTVIEYHLEDLAKKDWGKVAESLHIGKQEVLSLLKKIQGLHPKPTANFVSQRPTYLIPDLIVEYDSEKERITIQLNDAYLPEIRFNDSDMVNYAEDQEAIRFVKQQHRRFQWLRQSLEQRRRTILNIAQVVFEHQRLFLKEGFRSLRALTLQDVAEELGIHESTVSRATKDKIVQTPQGSFEFRRLFSTGVKGHYGQLISRTKIKYLIKEIVMKENKGKPLSDQKIAEILAEKYQVTISRRTVAKYREELHIPSSARRRQIVRSYS